MLVAGRVPTTPPRRETFPANAVALISQGSQKQGRNSVSARAQPRGLQIFCSQLLQWTPDTAFILLSVFSFFLSLGINIKVKELCRVCLREHKSFCSLPYSLALK